MESYFMKKLFDIIWKVVYEYMLKLFKKIKSQKMLKQFFSQQQKEYIDCLPIDEEFDYEGLCEFLKDEADSKIILFKLYNDEIKKLKIWQSLLNQAWYYSKAITAKQKETVKIFIKRYVIQLLKEDVNFAFSETSIASSEANSQFKKNLLMLVTNSTYDSRVARLMVQREKTVAQLIKFTLNNQMALMTGIGGIGKSIMAKMIFLQVLTVEFDADIKYIGYMEYHDSMDVTVLRYVKNVDYSNCNSVEEKTDLAWEKLIEIASNHKLFLIIDDISLTPLEDKSFEKLFSLNCYLLITSRFTTIDGFKSYKLDNMNEEQCKNIFETNYGILSNNDYEPLKIILNDVIKFHPLTTKLLACIARSNGWSVQVLKENLAKYGFDLTFFGQCEKRNLLLEYKKLFQISNLTPHEFNVLEALKVLDGNMPIKLAKTWLSGDIDNENIFLVITELCFKGWIENEDDCIKLHPVISECIDVPNLSHHLKLISECTNSLREEIILGDYQNDGSVYFGENIVRFWKDEMTNEMAMLSGMVATLYRNLGYYDKTLEFYIQMQTVYQIVFGENNPKTALAISNVAATYQAIGEYEKAIQLYRKILPFFQTHLSNEYQAISIFYSNIATTLSYLGEYKSALDFHNKSLDICQEHFGLFHYNTAVAYNNLADTYTKLGDNAESLLYYEKALEIQTKNDELLSSTTAIILDNMGGIYQSLEMFEHSLECYEKALFLNKQICGEIHLLTARTYNNLGTLYDDMELTEKAKGNYLLAYSILTQIGDRFEIQGTMKNLYQIFLFENSDEPDFEKWLSLCQIQKI